MQIIWFCAVGRLAAHDVHGGRGGRSRIGRQLASSGCGSGGSRSMEPLYPGGHFVGPIKRLLGVALACASRITPQISSRDSSRSSPCRIRFITSLKSFPSLRIRSSVWRCAPARAAPSAGRRASGPRTRPLRRPSEAADPESTRVWRCRPGKHPPNKLGGGG